MKILVTGGAGYIGSHTCLELLRSGFTIHVIDSLTNSSFEALNRVKRLSNRNLSFTKCDIRDSTALDEVFSEFQPDAVIHFAGLKAVAESIAKPALYYDVNVGGTAVLLGAMDRAGCDHIVFSSSATVYGEPRYVPCDENHPLDPINPYGRTKLMGERLIQDWTLVDSKRRAVVLRYFNPVGADPSGAIGEDPNELPNNLMPFLAQIAVGRQEFLKIFGNDYDTTDGTGMRDYIHVSDLAIAHVSAIKCIRGLEHFEVINIGTGRGFSVLQMVREFEKQSGKKIKYKIAPRRAGDVAAAWADASKAKCKIGFQAAWGITRMCIDTWRWQSENPDGYSKTKKP